jgi:hypothetical protein
MAALLAFLAAVAFALGNVLQQKGTLETDAGGNDPRFLVQILRRPVWLFGALAQGAGWVLQAVALDKGSIIVVQSITMLSLVIALPFGAWLTHQRITRRVIGGAAATVGGIVVFLSIGSPSGGTSSPDAAAWWSTILFSVILIGTCTMLARTRTGAGKAMLLGAAAGFCFALQVSVTKVFVTQVDHGVLTLLSQWTTYALIASALIGFVLQQSALKTGVLAPAMASSNAVTLFGSTLIAVTTFGEDIATGQLGGHVATAVGLAVALSGVMLPAAAPPPQIAETARSGLRPVPN